ncbi:hypothetical protein CTAYLR_010402 [Chrysophaeum taylorii]|uniref:Chlorophyll a-b binding protein, chloroplastic n=1 Tax=Chrysophaeum taylorii TaxID=2483200 RepID=A0AAD7XRU1_9STRA|nr:hypothetical protein CTAYLR_010402 [Chrysophaeum taylorii]
MSRVVHLLSFVSAASAFMAAVPAATPRQVALKESLLEGLEGATPPMGLWDPLGLAEIGSEKTIAWYRQAEIKHGRVAMFATVGWIVNELGIHFPGNIATGVPFASLGKGVDAWIAVPDAGKAQMIAFVGLLELGIETEKPHYMMGGKLGYCPGPARYGKLFDPNDFVYKSNDEAALAKLRNKELNNGRLAMIAVMGFFAASYIDGSVPLLPPTW